MRTSATLLAALALAALALAALALAAAASAAPLVSAASSATPISPGSSRLAGLWNMRGYVGSAGRTARERIARDVNGNIPPMLPWARDLLEKRVSDADQAGNLFANSAALCLPQGVPYMIFGAVEGPIQIFEEQGQVSLITEEGAEIWDIYLNQQHPPREDIEPTYHGDSVGHWEGDTLVIDTLGLNTKTTLDQVGMPHSDAMHVITRVRRTDADTLEFLVTIDDPKTFSGPWTRRVIYKKSKPGERRREYVCENNRNQPDAQGHQSFQTH
jgi:hypothetical protein